MTDAVGPIFAAGFQHVGANGYTIVYLPDLHNDELQREGKAPVYWWLPNEVRLARRNGDQGDYKFSFIHFVGVRSDSTTVGVEGTEEVSGGLLGLSTTAAPPASVLLQSQEDLLNRFRGSDDRWWGWRTPVAPMFRPAPIVSNTTSITNLSPNADGSVPAIVPDPPGPPGPGRSANGSRPPTIKPVMRPPFARSPRSIQLREAQHRSNLDSWYANLQGAGSGSVSPLAENAYSGLVGSLPAALIWSSFHGGTGGISVWQKMKMKVWSPVIRLKLHGDWSRIQSHYSAAAHAGGWFWAADIQAEFNNLRISGGIEVVVEVDATLPGADKLQEEMSKRSDLVFQKFMEQAQKTIFEPAPFVEEPAEASGGFLGWGGGAAFKVRRDAVNLTLDYEERKELAYLQDYPISGQLEGLYDEIKADPAAEKKYFTTLYLEDWDRKVSRTVKAVVNWPDPAKQWVGYPVSSVAAQIGYPNVQGAIQWDSHRFQRTDPPDTVWNTATAMKKAEDVTNPPPGWTPDKTYVKRQVFFTEPPTEAENPFVRVAVEMNTVDVDPGDYGTLTSDVNLDLRADSVGILSVGPIFLDVPLEDAKQVIEVTFKAHGRTHDNQERQPVRFMWKNTDQEEARYWMIFTGQPEFVASWEYQVRVIVKGNIFTEGMEWTGPVEPASGNGPFMARVPRQDEAGVVPRALPFQALATSAPASGGNGTHPPQTAEQPSTTPPQVPSRPARPREGVPAAGSGTRDIGGWSMSVAPASRATPPQGGAAPKSRDAAYSAEPKPMFTGRSTRPPVRQS